MRKIYLLILAVAFTVSALAASPFPPWLQKYIDQIPNKNGRDVQRVARATFDIASTGGAAGTYNLGVSLPKGAIITRSWYYVATAFTDAGDGTVAISCEDANNIVTAVDITGKALDSVNEGESTGAASAFKKSIAAGCNITATVAGSSIVSTGKANIYVEFVAQDS